MSTEPAASPDTRSTDAPPRTGLLKVAAATGVGTSLEFYDFAIYGTATALVFTDTFFRSDDAWFATFMGLATFGIGFLMAPLGALLFGWIGDRKGRRTALMMTFVGMGLATVLMGLLPPYAVIGVAAPLLLVLLRMVHGLARGGETGGAATLAMEHAPPQHRALWGVFTALGSPLGTILANVAFALVLLLPREAVASWGWRLPFLFGGVVLVLGLWVRRSVHESPVFQDMVRHAGEVRRAPAAEVFRTGWRRVLLAAGANIGLNSMTFVLAIFMLSYATAAAPQGLGLPRGPVVAGSIVALLLHALANVAGAVASDRFGRRPVMITGAVASMGAALVLFPVAEGGTVTAFVLAVSLGFLTTGVLFGPMYVYFGELFPREQRQTGMGIAYHVGAVLGGGISPLVANRILALTGDAANIGFYLAGALLLTLCCLALLPETAPRKVDAAATAPVVGT